MLQSVESFAQFMATVQAYQVYQAPERALDEPQRVQSAWSRTQILFFAPANYRVYDVATGEMVLNIHPSSLQHKLDCYHVIGDSLFVIEVGRYMPGSYLHCYSLFTHRRVGSIRMS